ncbi:elongation of very long chain fatty acids protein F-like [Drosophila serrata]|uniref:elongation of very long chain fatty acids protein F-like n=1 Tax=Drosophila serrata TaxID=7274 RepID=UPI000A1D17B0|nr:elongation of very long chain fatty acids protein F-like [Drosophila serrata]
MTAYLLFVLKVGPKLMERRQPFELRGVIKAYNIIQIVYNSTLFIYACYVAYNFYDMRCPVSLPLDHEGKDQSDLSPTRSTSTNTLICWKLCSLCCAKRADRYPSCTFSTIWLLSWPLTSPRRYMATVVLLLGWLYLI